MLEIFLVLRGERIIGATTLAAIWSAACAGRVSLVPPARASTVGVFERSITFMTNNSAADSALERRAVRHWLRAVTFHDEGPAIISDGNRLIWGVAVDIDIMNVLDKVLVTAQLGPCTLDKSSWSVLIVRFVNTMNDMVQEVSVDSAILEHRPPHLTKSANRRLWVHDDPVGSFLSFFVSVKVTIVERVAVLGTWNALIE
jgi:hypothetical protein